MATTAGNNLMVILGTNFHRNRNILCIIWVDNGSGLKCVSEVNYDVVGTARQYIFERVGKGLHAVLAVV
jgi:hypothetical protein